MFASDKKDTVDVVASFEAALRACGLADGKDGPTVSAVRGPSTSPPTASAKRSLAALAEFVERDLVGRCKSAGGERAGQTWVRLDIEQVETLKQLAAALAFMAPYDDTIRRAIKRAKTDGEA